MIDANKILEKTLETLCLRNKQYKELKSSHDELYEKNVQLLEAAKFGLEMLQFVKKRPGVDGMFMNDIVFLHSSIEKLEQAIAKSEGR